MTILVSVLCFALLAVLLAAGALYAKSRAALNALRAETAHAGEEAERRLAEAVAAKEAEGRAALEGRDALLRQVREAHERELAQLRAAHETETQRLREQAKRDEEAAKQNLDLTVKTQTAALDAKLADIQKALAEASTKSVRDSSDTLKKDNLAQVNEALQPFLGQLDALKKALADVHDDAAAQKERSERQFNDMMSAAQGVKAEAGKLSTALHGGAKVQGNWGEMVLDNILSASGLRDGEDYVRQSGGATDGGGIPDVVVNLPEGRKVVIDSKVVLTHWQDYLDADTDERREQSAKENVAALRKQVASLADRDYPRNTKGSLSHALLFVPVEASYALAMKSDPQLFMDAFRKNVVIVSPSTLVVTLEIVRQLWRQERIEKRLGEIARTGESLYNKLANFAKSMESVGKSLAKASNAFTTAKKQLSEGTGNAVRIAERLCSQLGLKPNLRIAEAMPCAEADAEVIDAEAVDAETAAAIAAAGADEPPADGDGASA